MNRFSIVASTVFCLTLALGGTARAEDAPTYELEWGSQGSAPGQFDNSRAITFDPLSNCVYVAERWNGRVQKFSDNGNFLFEIDLASPRGVAVDASGNFFVLDTTAGKVYKYTSSGSLITSWGSVGTGNGQFGSPNGIAVDPSGNVFVADTWNYRIQKFSSSGAFITKWGDYGTGPSQFSFPRAVCTDSQGNVFVVDSGSSRIMKFTNDGTYRTHWGSYGSGNGQFSSPYGIAIDTNDNIHIVDTNNHRIQKFTNNGNFIMKWGAGGSGPGQFSAPKGAAIAPNGDFYVADSENNRVQKFGAGGGGSSSTGILDGLTGLHIRMYSASPNPFSRSTVVRFDLEEAGPVRLQVFDYQGRLVRTLRDVSDAAAGVYDAAWDGHNEAGGRVPPGMYFFRLQTSQAVVTQKVSLIH